MPRTRNAPLTALPGTVMELIAALDAEFPDHLPSLPAGTSAEQIALYAMRLRGRRDVVELLLTLRDRA